jgi:hypothetical protein
MLSFVVVIVFCEGCMHFDPFFRLFARVVDRWIGVAVFTAQLGSFIYWTVILVQLTRKWSYSR